MKTITSDHPTVYIAGHNGMVGSALCRCLRTEGYTILRPSSRVDLRDQNSVMDLIGQLRPHWVFLAAAKVGGIQANVTYPAEFIYDNLMIQTNIIHASYVHQVEKLLFLGSSCIYPRLSCQPIKEDYLLSSHLEPTNAPYAVAKIAGIITAQSYNRQYGTSFISVMPTNLYGPGDNFDPQNSHVVPGLLRRTHEARVSNTKYLEIWGSGNPRREFLHIDDLADACSYLMKHYDSDEIINIGSGEEVTIFELAELMKKIVGCKAELVFNSTKPDGTPRKFLDTTKLHDLGWRPSRTLEAGLRDTYVWFLENLDTIRKGNSVRQDRVGLREIA